MSRQGMVMAMPCTTGRTRVNQASSASVLSSASGNSRRVSVRSVCPWRERRCRWSFWRTLARTPSESACSRCACRRPRRWREPSIRNSTSRTGAVVLRLPFSRKTWLVARLAVPQAPRVASARESSVKNSCRRTPFSRCKAL